MDVWILVVDDNPLVSRALRAALRAATGAQVVAAPDGRRGVALVSCAGRPPPVCLVLDLDLGGGHDGAQALRALRGHGCASPAAFFTGHSEPEVAEKLADAGVVERPPVFAKPGGLRALFAWAGRLATAGGAPPP